MGKTQTQMAQIQHSTNASPFSATYPYQEISNARPKPSQPLPPEDDQPKLRLPSPRDDRRRAPQAQLDLNRLHVQFSGRPSWSFGGSGRGFRFQQNGKLCQTSPCAVTRRQVL